MLYTKFAKMQASQMIPTDAEPYGPRDHVIRAFDRALSRVGYDLEACELWTAYIDFYRNLSVLLWCDNPLVSLHRVGARIVRAAATDGGHAKALPTGHLHPHAQRRSPVAPVRGLGKFAEQADRMR